MRKEGMGGESHEAELPEKQGEINFHEVSRERAALRRSLEDLGISSTAVLEDIREGVNPVERSLKEGNPIVRTLGKKIAEELAGVDKIASEFKVPRDEEKDTALISSVKGSLGRQKEAAESSSTKWIDEGAIRKEIGPSYDTLSTLAGEEMTVGDFELRTLREDKNDPYARKARAGVLGTVRQEKVRIETARRQEEEEHPSEARAFDLVSYKQGLHEEGHLAATSSVKKAVHEIGNRMIAGKPMFLHGPTGTGKTSLARYAAKHFTGKDAEMVYCNPQTREANIWGKTGIRPAAGGAIETVDVYGPLARAASEGKVVAFDEFNALPKEQMVFIKGVLNAKVGDKLNIMGNGMVEIKPGFQMIFTANLKSEKNPERSDLPPEIAREFEQNNFEIPYTPKEEAYDIMLARLMNRDGSVDLSWNDIKETLPKFCEAMEEVQTAYTGAVSEDMGRLTGTSDASGKRPSLKKLVFTQGTTENIFEAWMTERQSNPDHHSSFAEFLDGRLKTALTFREYPETDRVLTAKILASKGLLRTVTAKDLGLPANTFEFDAAKRARGNEQAIAELKQRSAKESHISIKELAELDPWNLRGKKAAEEAAQFLGPDAATPELLHTSREVSEEEMEKEVNSYMEERIKGWYGNADAQKAKPKLDQMVLPREILWKNLSKDKDASKFGEYMMNPETANIDWETVPPEKIKVIDLSDMAGKELYKVAEKIVKEYGDTHDIPGIEFWKYIIEHPDKAPESLKDGNYHFFFGSVFRGGDGGWRVPYARWYGSGFNPYGDWLTNHWNSGGRVVLLEK
jgi:MoxR-like ATPase